MGHMNSNTVVAGSQWVLVGVKFRAQKGSVWYNKGSSSGQGRRSMCLCSPFLQRMSQNSKNYICMHVDPPRTHRHMYPEHLLRSRVGWMPHFHPTSITCIRFQHRSLRRVSCVHEDKKINPSVLHCHNLSFSLSKTVEYSSTTYWHSSKLSLVKNILTYESQRTSSYCHLPQKKPDQNKIRKAHNAGVAEADFCRQ